MRIWHCETQEQYDYLMKQLEAEGCRWRSGVSPTQLDYWGNEREETCIKEKTGLLSFQNKEYFEYLYPTIKTQPIIIPDPTPADSIRELIRQDKEGKHEQARID